ncbi:hypothetical protein RND71_043631 [Anisodus tanguticus]|uniref:Uncharacterized protein n=1 Tax=Anisodus tanguticus TaxID=243964 RepID=A0AAE1UTD6_9SOLA|nr:hypothetical protein RND71_043631 [Anisodus tanguticus]
MYQGIYNTSQKHCPDLKNVLQRAWNTGLEKVIITSGCVEDVEKSIEIIKNNENFSLYTTVGCHPTRCTAFDEINDEGETYLNKLEKLYTENKKKIVAIGELGLDYDRLNFCSKTTQYKYFEKQLNLVKKTKLPMFLHCRNAEDDFKEVLKKYDGQLFGGVVHSFDGKLEDAKEYINLGYYIGLNGCSLRTNEGLKVASQLPLDKILIETDAPWCEIKPTHPSFQHIKTKYPTKKKEKFEENFMIKGRNEPCNIIQIFEVLCSIRDEKHDEIQEKIYDNTIKLFFQHENL